MSVFGVILVRIFPHSDWITPNTDTFHAVLFLAKYLIFVAVAVANITKQHLNCVYTAYKYKCSNTVFLQNDLRINWWNDEKLTVNKRFLWVIFVNLFNNFGAISKFQLIMGSQDRLMGLLFWVFVSVNLIKSFSWYVTHCSYDRIKLIQCRTFIKHTIPSQQNSLLSIFVEELSLTLRLVGGWVTFLASIWC